MKLRKDLAKATRLRAVRPNVGLQAIYQSRLDALIAEMQADILAHVPRAYEANEPEMAQDASPARELRAIVRRLGRKWERRFDEAAPELARYFATAAADRSTRQLHAILKRAGFAVDFRMTREVNDIVQATIGENVALIRSIPAQHFTAIEGDVMRSVAAGRDLGPLAAKLEAQYGVTNRRAALIARDQNNKATATVTRARQMQAGITQATWLHSGGGREPRPSHVKFSGKPFDLAKGAYIDGEWIFPGELINCRCVSRPLIPGFS